MQVKVHWLLAFFALLVLENGRSGTEATTVIAAKCSDGIVLAADSLSANGGGGILISSRTSKKVFMLTQSTAICTVASSGNGAVHFQQLYNELRETIRSHQTSFESTLTSSAIINVARQLVNNKYNEAHVVIAGWEGGLGLTKMDPESVSKNLITIYPESVKMDSCNYVLSEILPGGSRIDQTTVIAGSGSSFISNLLEESLTHSDFEIKTGGVGGSGLSQLSVTEALPKLRKCLSLAAKLDPQTGGDKFSLWVLTRHNQTDDAIPTADAVSQPLR